ncbi:MAG: extracellular solute-binding protein [Acidobacteria bacterium]|nr:extracellular solute-binding protein [Acidobacteriota bacterium]
MSIESRVTTTVALVLALVLVHADLSAAGDIKVMTSGAFTAAYLELVPELERVTGEKVITLATSMGTGAESIPARLQRGEPADVVIVADAALDDLAAQGIVITGSRVDLARSAIGMAVRAGAPKPDISTLEGLKQALLQAKSIAYSTSVSGIYFSTELVQRLGIADQVLAKSRRVERERVAAVVARGEAEIGFQQISELLPVPGIDYVGPLPPEAQRETVFAAAVVTHAKNPNGARAAIGFLASPNAVRAITASGLEPAAVALPGDEQRIREARARSNAAIAKRDAEGIARLWTETVHVVSSTSAQTAGRQANRERMARQFASRPDTIYVRNPSEIQVYAAWDVASERGDWTGRWTEPDGALEIGGTYQAQWRRIDGHWLIHAEVFVPTRCTGSAYCSQRP